MSDTTVGSNPTGLNSAKLVDLGDGTYAQAVALLGVAGEVAQKMTAGGAAPGQTLFQYPGKQVLSASVPTTVTLFTVPAGKTAYITDLFLSHDSAAVVDTRLQAAGADLFRAPVKGDTAPVQMPGIETQPQAAAGATVTLLYPATAGPPSAYYFVAGYYQ